MIIGLLTGVVSASNHTKRLSLNIQKCMTKPNLINLYPNESSHELHNYTIIYLHLN